MYVFQMLCSMVIFGSVGIVTAVIPLSSPMIAGVRALIGTLFMGLVMIFRRSQINKSAMRKNAVWLILSGAALGVNWILLFEAYRYTSVGVATLCYYMAPVFVVLLSPLVLKERLSAARFVCVLVALGGMVLVSGASLSDAKATTGILFALGAAALYCAVVLINKRITRLPAQETTFFQLLAATAVTLPYALFTQGDAVTLSAQTVVPLLILGIVHTGVAYLLFFSAAGHLPAQSTAMLSYIDPVTAVVLAALVLDQIPTTLQIVGASMIVGGSILSELVTPKRKRR